MGVNTHKGPDADLKTRLDYLEEVQRFTVDALEMAAYLGDFQSNISTRQDPSIILTETGVRVRSLIPFRTIGFYLVNEANSDFYLADCVPEKDKTYLAEEIDFLINNGTFAWSLRENRAIRASTRDFEGQIILHVLTTNSRIRGLFCGILSQGEKNIPAVSLSLLSIIMLNSANALESLQIYEMLKKARAELEERVKERTLNLAEANERLKNDIAERKRAEEQLGYERQKFATLSEHAPFGMALVDKNGQFLYINPKYRDIFGYDLSDIPDGKRWFKKAYPDRAYRHNVLSAWLDNTNSAGYGEQRPRIFNTTCKDGSTKIINFIPVLLGNGDNIMVCEDITERRRLEMELIHAQKMEAIGTLAGGIAHDFNNILMGIQGYASLMMLDISTDHPHYEKLKRIEEQVKNAAGLAGQLLGFARGGKYVVKPVSLNELIEKTSTMFGRTKKEITIHRKYDKALWAIEADQGQIEQVLLNLYLNAWQAMPAGGDLSIETGNIIVGKNYIKAFPMPAGKYVRISITDTGVGMDEIAKERIFEPFFTTKELGRGTGLGLAMVYGIVKNHNGFIDVVSEPGKGATFSLFFPVSEKPVVKEHSPVPEIMRGTETILLVDDEPDVLAVSKAILESFGYRVHGVKNGEEAITLYTQKKDEIDITILDMIMPGLSGRETFERIREANPSAKVILSSGYSLNSQAQQIMNKGCHGFIQKPFDMTQISRMIRGVLDS
ncbi:MAG TPA: response regulator [Syntrophorhabdaceae bacterium]|jgi:PAS domain S-box-containing protein